MCRQRIYQSRSVAMSNKLALFFLAVCVIVAVCVSIITAGRVPGLRFPSAALPLPQVSIAPPSRRQLQKEDGRTDGGTAALEENSNMMPGPPTNSSTPIPSCKKSHGYLLVLHAIGGAQQAAGLRSFLPAQCWLGSFGLPMSLVQPFIENSVVHTVPPERTDTLTLSSFFDVDHYNNASRQRGWAGVASWQEFVENAPRKAIYITTHRNGSCKCLGRNEEDQEPLQVLWTKTEYNNSKCYYRNKDLHRLSTEHNFCVVRALKAHPHPRLCTAQEVYETIFGRWRPEDVTLIVDRWCPGMYVPNPALSNPGVCKTACAELTDMFHPSHQLQRHTESYEKTYSADGGNFRTAVMLRSEHVLTEASIPKDRINYLSVCLSRTVEIVHSLHGESVGEQLFVTVDVGRYGSSNASWMTTLQESDPILLLLMVMDTAMNLLNTSLTFEEWEETFAATAGTRDRGYIAALQQSIASSAKCLVILGGGNFPRLTLMQYLSKHPDPSTWCIHFVCLSHRYSREYSYEIRKQSQGSVDANWVPVADTVPRLYVGSLYRDGIK